MNPVNPVKLFFIMFGEGIKTYQGGCPDLLGRTDHFDQKWGVVKRTSFITGGNISLLGWRGGRVDLFLLSCKWGYTVLKKKL